MAPLKFLLISQLILIILKFIKLDFKYCYFQHLLKSQFIIELVKNRYDFHTPCKKSTMLKNLHLDYIK